MRGNQPKFLTKAELREAAMRELKISKNSFDFAWIDAIEETGLGEWLSATEAFALGLANKVLPKDEVLRAAREAARTLATRPLARSSRRKN
jgi:ATP-dependent protease ClpP protease subunit